MYIPYYGISYTCIQLSESSAGARAVPVLSRQRICRPARVETPRASPLRRAALKVLVLAPSLSGARIRSDESTGSLASIPYSSLCNTPTRCCLSLCWCVHLSRCATPRFHVFSFIPRMRTASPCQCELSVFGVLDSVDSDTWGFPSQAHFMCRGEARAPKPPHPFSYLRYSYLRFRPLEFE